MPNLLTLAVDLMLWGGVAVFLGIMLYEHLTRR